MPNHVHNAVYIRGPKITLDRITEAVKSEDQLFDFNRLIRMPDALRDLHTGNSQIGGRAASLWREKKVGEETVQIAVSPSEIAEFQLKYGATDWYEWSIKHWGTKWNAYEISVERTHDTLLSYSFLTAWSDPLPVYEKLSVMFPDVTITVKLSGEIDDPCSYKLRGGKAVRS